MRKLRLDPDALAVDSFEPRAADEARRGTVQGNEALVDTGVYSCWATCRCPSHHNTECCGII
jgi:hypothetical protein